MNQETVTFPKNRFEDVKPSEFNTPKFWTKQNALDAFLIKIVGY